MTAKQKNEDTDELSHHEDSMLELLERIIICKEKELSRQTFSSFSSKAEPLKEGKDAGRLEDSR